MQLHKQRVKYAPQDHIVQLAGFQHLLLAQLRSQTFSVQKVQSIHQSARLELLLKIKTPVQLALLENTAFQVNHLQLQFLQRLTMITMAR